MFLYRVANGWVVEQNGKSCALEGTSLGQLLEHSDLHDYLESYVEQNRAQEQVDSSTWLAPIDRQEVWAAGVTYHRSRTARMEESKQTGGGDFYDRVYAAERPELFFKAMPHKVIGPGASVAIRRDATWSVPEPELALVISQAGRIVGYTIANDMSSRDIEGQNLLYLPQAKIYDRSCAVGPRILVRNELLPPDTRIVLDIQRSGETVFSGSTTLSEMKRRPEELVEYLFRDQTFPHGCFLLTGTGIVPPDSFTLESGDRIQIGIEPIGLLVNDVA